MPALSINDWVFFIYYVEGDISVICVYDDLYRVAYVIETPAIPVSRYRVSGSCLGVRVKLVVVYASIMNLMRPSMITGMSRHHIRGRGPLFGSFAYIPVEEEFRVAFISPRRLGLNLQIVERSKGV
ncbi:MAG: hypothetical protein Ct9H90mP5_03560 [Acidimicrobiaceae bacterium]|nr:MAG: hypothetical protein Ct9H90mP5_03560 [Acidimicrobiaceae bacterium]